MKKTFNIFASKNLKQTKNLTLFLISAICGLVLILINFYTIKILSTTRAYVNGETLYSKGHKSAVINLTSFLFTEEKDYWVSFNKDLRVPLGGAKARASLQKDLDTETIKEGFRIGRNDEADLDNMIWIYKTFKSYSFIKKIVQKWKQGDELNFQLNKLGHEILSKSITNKLDSEEKHNYLKKIMTNTQLFSKNQESYSNLFEIGSRRVKEYLIYINIFFIIVILSSVRLYYTSLIEKLILSKQKLNRRKTKLKVIIKDLKKTKEDLSTGLMQHRKIIGSISHDIRSPLKYIQLISKHLEKETIKKNDLVSTKYANSIYKSSTQLYEFTKTLIQYSKIYIHDRNYIQEPYSIHKLVAEKKDLFEEIALNKGVTIENNIDKDLLSTVNIKIMSIIIHNLIDNAIKNTSKGQIELGVLVDEFKTTYWVKDTGVGMSQDVMDYYSNLSKNRDPEKLILSTYGIGLHLVLELLIIIKGEIFFSSVPNKGTTILIQIKHAKNKSLTKS